MEPSLYIPIISNVTESYVIKMFKINNIGRVSRVDFVKNLEKSRVEAFVHFEEWFNTAESQKLQEDIKNPALKTKFVYTQSGKYWPILNHKKKDLVKDLEVLDDQSNSKYENITSANMTKAYKEALQIILSKGKGEQDGTKKSKSE